MIITDYNRCKGCINYTKAVQATAACFAECVRVPYEKSNIMHFIARGKYGSVEYRLDLRGISTLMNSGQQNKLLFEILDSDHPRVHLAQWLEYLEWLHEHEYEVTPGPVRRRMETLRNKLITFIERCPEE